MDKPLRISLVVGEASGDELGADLWQHLMQGIQAPSNIRDLAARPCALLALNHYLILKKSP